MNMRPEDLEELIIQEELDRRRARESFLPFYMRMTGMYPPRHFRKIAALAEALESDVVDRAMLFAPPRHIKRCADTTPILTANRGWTTHGDLRAGDTLYHPSGGTTEVLAVHPPDLSDREVHFLNGGPIRCDAGHLWTVCDAYHRRKFQHDGKVEWQTLTTEQIEASGLDVGGPRGKRGSRLRWKLPEFLGSEGAHLDTDMGPYALGVWLGDGSTGHPRITMSAQDMALVIPGFLNEGYEPGKFYLHKDTAVPTQSFARQSRGHTDKCRLSRDLEREGVLYDKHVPERWLSASRAQRKLLLAGLIDSDGSCEAKTGRYRIVTSSQRMAESIHALCATLGYRPYVTPQDPVAMENRYKIQTRQRAYTVAFQPHDEIPCRIDRKRARKTALRRLNAITEIRRVEPESARCISVSAHDGLYLVGRDLIPTHNTLGISTLFPAWIMGRHPATKIMSVVHTDRYAKKLGKNVRNLLRSPQWPFDEDAAPFEDVGLADDSQAKEQWATPQGGEYNGFGMFGGNQHGNPAEWLFMDDVIKGRKVAMSMHMRDEAWETYKADLLSRLQGRRKQVIAITRWHQDDPPGRILPENYDGQSGWFQDRETGEDWYVLSLQAVAEHENDPLGRKPGEWLWPEAFGEKQLGGMRKRGGWMWSALYQQRPSPAEGLMFTAEHIQRYDKPTLDLTRMQIYIASDYAVTDEGQGDNPDWTVHQVWAVDDERNIYLLDIWRGRTQSDVWVREWIRLVRKWKPLRAFEESGQIIKAVGPLINALIQDERVFVSRVQITSTSDKPSRAQSLLGLASMGKMYLPHRHQVSDAVLLHLDAFEKELMTFPGGTKDDTVDAATLFARGIDRVVLGKKPGKAREAHGDTLDDLWEREGR